MLPVTVSKGNKKLPSSTWILNSGSATDCPSKKLGLCQCANKCYALKAERQYKTPVAFRRRQAELYSSGMKPQEVATELLAQHKRARTKKMKTFRFNESGDFADQGQVDWFQDICKVLATNGIRCYGYTARTDLDLSGLLNWASVNVSNDNNGWVEKGANRFKAVPEYTGNNPACAGDCSICNRCFRTKGATIEVKIH